MIGFVFSLYFFATTDWGILWSADDFVCRIAFPSLSSTPDFRVYFLWRNKQAGRVRNAAHAFRLSTPFMESFRSKTETLLATKPLTPDILAEVVADWSVKFKDFLVKDPPKFPLPKEFDKYLEKLFRELGIVS